MCGLQWPWWAALSGHSWLMGCAEVVCHWPPPGVPCWLPIRILPRASPLTPKTWWDLLGLESCRAPSEEKLLPSTDLEALSSAPLERSGAESRAEPLIMSGPLALRTEVGTVMVECSHQKFACWEDGAEVSLLDVLAFCKGTCASQTPVWLLACCLWEQGPVH